MPSLTSIQTFIAALALVGVFVFLAVTGTIPAADVVEFIREVLIPS